MNWYKESEYFSGYGAWLSPDGDITNVTFSSHEIVANKILLEKGYKFKRNEFAGSILRKMGYITLTFQGGLSIWYEVPPTDIQIKKIASLFNSRIGGDSYVRITSPGGNDFAKDVQELIKKLI